jgi:eukaryotic-like serine/threonine-protein kinase
MSTDRRDPQPTPTTLDVTRDSATLPGPAVARQRPPTPQPATRPTPPPIPRPAAVDTVPESDPDTAMVLKGSFVDLPPGSVVGDVYEIDAKIGKGAMGEVYAARHVKLGKRVAIKVIGDELSEDPAAIERFSQEARALAQIQHPAIVAVDHVGELADGRAYFVMELLRGEPLFSRLQREHLPLHKALRILDQIARGLEAAHAQGIIHRDLKPENIFLVKVPGESSVVKILDLGLSKLKADVDRRAARTQSGAAIGTPMYMSPEQMRGPDVDHRTDIYALGCVAYELVLGRVPFPHARTAPELYAAHLHEAPPLPRAIWPEIPPQLDLMLFAMLAKDPDHRPTLAQIRSVIADVRTGTPSQRARTEYGGKDVVPPRSPAGPLTIAIALATLLVGMSVGALMSRHASKTPDAALAPVVTIDAAAATATIAPIADPAPAPVKQPAVIDARPAATHPHVGSGSGSGSGAPRAISRPAAPKPDPAEIVMPDAGVGPIVEDVTTPPPPPRHVDRDQTLNPFAPKRNP